jgi:hypothetical protein
LSTSGGTAKAQINGHLPGGRSPRPGGTARCSYGADERVNAIHAASLERMVGSAEAPIKVSSNQACFKVRGF